MTIIKIYQGINMYKSIRSTREVRRLSRRSEEMSTRRQHFGLEKELHSETAKDQTLKVTKL